MLNIHLQEKFKIELCIYLDKKRVKMWMFIKS